MKNIFISLVLGSVLFSSCTKEDLELDPISAASDESFYQNSDDLELATIAIYDGLQAVPLREFAITEMRSDNTKSKSSEGDWGQFENFTVASTNQTVASYWADCYNVIFRANTVLQHIDVVTLESLKEQLEGEARFARALSHFNLVRAYGAVPILDKVITFDESDYFDRDPVSTVYDFIIQDLRLAIDLLPTNSSMDYGRATQGAAQGLLAKVYLNTGNYGEAQVLLSTVINSGEYALESNYEDVFYNEGNDEILFAIPYIDDDANESQDFSFEMTAGGVRAGLNYLTDDFIANINPDDTIRNPVLRNPSNEAEVGKFLTESDNARLCGNDWIVLRLADVYLMHVEAIMAGFPSTQNLDAIASFNEIRARAGLELIPTDGSGEITLEMLLDERRIELSFENHRLYDLIRTGQALTVLTQFADSEGYSFTATDLLLPIPLREINVSQGLLTQNPGYN